MHEDHTARMQGQRHLPVWPRVVVYEGEELFLHLVPALKAAPQPVRADYMQMLALLRLAHLLCACRDHMSDHPAQERERLEHRPGQISPWEGVAASCMQGHTLPQPSTEAGGQAPGAQLL